MVDRRWEKPFWTRAPGRHAPLGAGARRAAGWGVAGWYGTSDVDGHADATWTGWCWRGEYVGPLERTPAVGGPVPAV